MFCGKCGAEAGADARFCSKCVPEVPVLRFRFDAPPHPASFFPNPTVSRPAKLR